MADATDVGIIGSAVGAGLYGLGWAAKKLFANGKESNGHRTIVECAEIHKQNSREHAELHEKVNKVAEDVAFIRGWLEHKGGAS